MSASIDKISAIRRVLLGTEELTSNEALNSSSCKSGHKVPLPSLISKTSAVDVFVKNMPSGSANASSLLSPHSISSRVSLEFDRCDKKLEVVEDSIKRLWVDSDGASIDITFTYDSTSLMNLFCL